MDGPQRIDETMLYVHVAEAHMRELPDAVREAGNSERDPDRRIIAMLEARGRRGKNQDHASETRMISAT